MSYTFSLEQTFKTGKMDGNITTRQYFRDLNAKFTQEKSLNPKLKPGEIAKHLNISTSTIEGSRREIIMKSP